LFRPGQFSVFGRYFATFISQRVYDRVMKCRWTV
jgi:hypothetical protein